MLKKDGTCVQSYDDCEKCNPNKPSQCLKCRVSVPRQQDLAPQLTPSAQPVSRRCKPGGYLPSRNFQCIDPMTVVCRHAALH
jgi:hypothetical protein